MFFRKVESSWTVTKLSPTLSCLDCFSSGKDALRACIRRSLIYPLYRNWQLSSVVLQDVVKIFALGRRGLLKCLLTIRKLCSGVQENRYILNDLYLTSYCVWIQTVSEAAVEEVRRQIGDLTVEKVDLNLDLEATEAAAFLAVTEQEGRPAGAELVNLEDVLAKLTVVDSDDDDDQSEE